MSLAAASSDPREFREVYRSHHGFVWHALHRFGLRGAALEDALQDVFVVAYRRRADVSRSLKAWLYAIARRVASNHRRSARRHVARTDALAMTSLSPAAAVPEAIVALDRYLDGLDPADRELFILSEVEGMTGPEIAAAWGRNLNTVYTRIRKLRASLRGAAIAERARTQRPAASQRAWLALLPSLQPVPAASGAVLGLVGLAVAAAVAVVAVVSLDDEPTPPEVRTNEERVQPRSSPPVAVASPIPAAQPQLTVAVPDEPPQPRARAPRTHAEPPQPAPAPSTLARENALLQRARTALGDGRPDDAMRLLDEHASAFPKGALQNVRAVVRIEALCEMGKGPQARAEARALLDARPSMTARRRIEKTCAATQRNRAKPDMTGA